MSFLSSRLLLGNEHRLLGLMMVTLIAALAFIDDINISRSLFITHFGFFLLWQPIYKKETQFSMVNLVSLITLISAFIIWLNIWLTPIWLLLLLSLLTGRIFSRGLERVAYGIAIIVIFLQLILVTTPDLFSLYSFTEPVRTSINLILIIMLLP
jgi:hypothetical protein